VAINRFHDQIPIGWIIGPGEENKVISSIIRLGQAIHIVL
jgi:hypothetical protein